MAVESGARVCKTLTGDLRSRPLAVLLAGACERATSGTFAFRHGARHDSLVMRLGKIAAVRTSDPIAYLGGVLYELGTIDIATLNETLHEIARTKRRHGDVLFERGAVTRERLGEGLIEQTFRKVHHLFTLPEEAMWSFREDIDELAGARDEDRPPIETWPAIWRGLRELPPPAHVRHTLSKLGATFHLSDVDAVRRLGLAPEEMALCEGLNAQPSSLGRLTATGHLVAARTEMLVYLLALARCIIRVDAQPVGPVELGVQGVRDRAQRLSSEDDYTTLGLKPDASPEAARAAYFRLVRLWHPDKIPAAFDEVRAECARVFVRLNEAHRSISDVGVASWRRAEAVIDAAGGSGAPAANDSLAPRPGTIPVTLAAADAALARNDIAAAEAIARSLTSAGADGPGARAVIAWCAIGATTNAEPARLEHALGVLDRILTGDPNCLHALYYRARILKRLGRTDDAVRDFRKIVRANPRHIDALREVRLYELRRRAGKERGDACSSSVESPAKVASPGPHATAGADVSLHSGLRRFFARVTGKQAPD